MTPGALPNPEPNDSSPKPKRTRKAPASSEAKPAAKRGPTDKAQEGCQESVEERMGQFFCYLDPQQYGT